MTKKEKRRVGGKLVGEMNLWKEECCSCSLENTAPKSGTIAVPVFNAEQ